MCLCKQYTLIILYTTDAISEFPAFQEHILSNGLCSLVMEIAKNDGEYYVRASALKCISQMIPVNLFWEQCFSGLDLIVRDLPVLERCRSQFIHVIFIITLFSFLFSFLFRCQ